MLHQGFAIQYFNLAAAEFQHTGWIQVVEREARVAAAMFLDEFSVRRQVRLAHGTLAHEFQHLIHWGSDADEELAMLRSWADKQAWAEFEENERVKAAMSDMQQGGAAVLMEGIPDVYRI